MSRESTRCLSLSAQRSCFYKQPPRLAFRKEVIQPQVLLQLPCYDFTPIMNHTVVTCPPKGRLSHF
jgi:hypothetical protein